MPSNAQELEEYRRQNGEFGTRPRKDATLQLGVKVDGPDAAFSELYRRVDGAEGELVAAAGKALSAIIKDSYPNATAITVVNGADAGEERHLVLASILEGENTVLDATLGGADGDLLDAVGEWTPVLGRDISSLDRVKKHKIWGLALTGEAGEDALAAATSAANELVDLADNGNKRLGELARQSVEQRVKEKFPEAASVILVNENSDPDGGSPYLCLQSVHDASGIILYEADDDEDYEFTEYVNDWTVACDRDLDGLEDIDEGMLYEGAWRLTF